MELSLVIPAFNEEKYIGATLESVLKNAPGAFKEIIVVDNASTDRTGEVARGFPGVTVIREDRKGTGFAREAGFRAATAEILAFIDADTRLRQGWVEGIRRSFERDPGLACVTGPYWFYDLPPITRALLWANWHFAPIGNLFTGTLVVGGNFAIRRTVLEKMNGFDTSILFHGDDVDIGVRAAQFGKVKLIFSMYLESSGRRYRAKGTLVMVWWYIYHGFMGGMLRIKSGSKDDYEEVR